MQSESDSLRDEIHRKIGQNIILLQRIELALKSFVARQNITLSVNLHNPESPSLQDQIKQKRETVARKTMGCVSRLFCDTVLADSKPHPDSDNLAKGEARLTFSFHPFDGHNDAQKEFIERLNSVVEDRNRIVHQLFTTFDLSESGTYGDLSTFLDQLHQKANLLFDDLKEFQKIIQETILKTNNSAISPFPNEKFKHESIQLFSINLILFSSQSSNTNKSEWTELAKSGKFIHQQCRDHYIKSKNKYKSRSFRDTIIKTELFDLKENDGKIFYRIKQEYHLEINKDRNIIFCKRIKYKDGSEDLFKEELLIQLSTDPPVVL